MKKVLFLLISLVAIIYPQSELIYKDDEVARVDITINPTSLEWIYNNVQSDSEHVATIRFKNSLIDETTDSIGFRLRGNTSRTAQKKSFRVSFNKYVKGRKFFDVEKLNFKADANDPTLIRTKLSFDQFTAIGMKATRSSYVELYINGKYYGLYNNVEHLDEEYIQKNYSDDSGNLWKCVWPASLIYIGDNQNSYKTIMNGNDRAYELQTNEEADDYTLLIKLAKTLSASQIIPDSIEKIVEVDEVLKYLAMNILVGGWDGYWNNMNNYYLYHEPSIGKFHILPYDYDNTFGIDWWSNNWASMNPYSNTKITQGDRPLAEKLLANAQYRNLYTHFLQFYNDNMFKVKFWESRIDSIHNLITPYAELDTFRIKDFGFTIADFNSSYGLNYTKNHVKTGLKQFIDIRNATLSTQLVYLNAPPVVYQVDYKSSIKENDSISISLAAFSKAGIKEALLKVKYENDTTLYSYNLMYSPVNGTMKVEEADRYLAVVPFKSEAKNAQLYITITDSANLTQLYPRTGRFTIIKESSANSVIINEFLADNVASQTDPSGEFSDWVELYNPTNSPINLTGMYLTDSPLALTKHKISNENLVLNPNDYLVVWLDEELAEPGVHGGFKLSKGGEYIAIVDTNGVSILDSLSFGPQGTDISFGRWPNGSQTWGFLIPSPGFGNIISSVNELFEIPKQFDMHAYPNPFNPSTILRFYITNNSLVNIKLYDALGKEIKTLVNEEMNAGQHEYSFNGQGLASGLYFCRIVTGGNNKTIKLLLVK